MSQTARLLGKIRIKAESEYKQKINYAKGAFLPFDRCKNTCGFSYFVSSVEPSKIKSAQMIRSF